MEDYSVSRTQVSGILSACSLPALVFLIISTDGRVYNPKKSPMLDLAVLYHRLFKDTNHVAASMIDGKVGIEEVQTHKQLSLF